MKTSCLIILFLIFLLGGCSSWKDMMVVKGNQDDAIKNAIIDFLRVGRFVKGYSVFSIHTENINGDIIGISILGEENKISVITENEIDYSYKAFPTKYFEQDGKLFYWRDSTENVPPELIIKLSKMNRIDTAIVNKFFPRRVLDDAQKAVDYYFCKSNLKKYKRVHTSRAMGWYDPPKINCNSD